jgi:hypothetical protein
MLVFWHNLGCNKEIRMSRKSYTAAQIIGMLHEVEVALCGVRNKGTSVGIWGLRSRPPTDGVASITQ